MEIDRRGFIVDRRAFVRVVTVSVLGLTSRRSLALPQASPALTIGFVTSGLGAASTGFDFGLKEAEQSARLFGKRINAVRHSFSSSADAVRTVTGLSPNGQASVIIAGGDDAVTRDLAEACIRNGALFMNVTARSDDLRRSLCSPLVYHIEASDAMYAAAMKIVQASSAGDSSQANPDIVLWNSSLERYGASQLNDRYRASAGVEMTGPAWAAWMAVKIVSEAYFRTGNPSAGSIAAYLGRDSTQFDGHKGAPLSFRSWDHQLRQPLYSVSGQIVKDIPDLSRSSQPARELLDTIGDSQASSQCKVLGQ